jgi:hypothetical protein
MQDCIVFYLAHHADFVDHAHPVFSLYTHDLKNFIVQSPCLRRLINITMDLKYDHFGVPVKDKRPGMIYYPEYKVWCSDYEKDPFRI